MEITFKNRPLRLTYLAEEESSMFLPPVVEKMRSLPNEHVIFSMIPVREGTAQPAFMDFLKHFDPDFILHPSDKTSDFKTIEENTSSFGILSVESFLIKFPALISHWGFSADEGGAPGETDPGEIFSSLPDLLEIAATYYSEEVTLVYPDPKEVLETGLIVIPQSVRGLETIDVHIRDHSGDKNACRIPLTKQFRRIVREANPSFPIRMTLPEAGSSFSILPVTPFGDVNIETFKLAPPNKLISLLFQELGYSIRPTHNISFMNLFGNLEKAAAFFLNSYAMPLLTHFASGGFRQTGAVRKIISQSAKFDSAQLSEHILDLLRNRILLRGYVLTCDYCNATDFYAMKEVDESYKCRSCHLENLTPLKLNPAFKLNQIITEGYRQGTVATILTLNYLRQKAHDSFTYSTELTLRRMNREMEIDLVCLVDGKMVIGEAKMGKLIKDRDFSPRDEFDKYKKLARELQAEQVVFSTMSEGFYDVPRSKIERFKKELAEEGLENIEVTILNRQDLTGNA